MATLVDRRAAPRRRSDPADEAPNAPSELAVELAHDVRSPLGAIIALTETLASTACGPVTEAQSRHLALILQAAQGIARVTDDMIDLGRPGKQEPDAAFEVPRVLSSVRSVVAPMAEAAGLALKVRQSAPNVWLGRRCAIERVLLNLSTNAVKYTQRGVVEVGASLVSPTALQFYVRDSGPGLTAFAASDTPAMGKDRWRRASSGLGLAISCRLLQSMGSSLDVESTPGKGCRFHFTLTMRTT